MIPGDNGAGCGQRIFFAQDGVSGSDCDFGNGEAVVHVAEIDHADDFSRLWPGRADQDVVIVGVAVDDAVAQRRQRGEHFRFIRTEKSLDEHAPLGTLDVLEIVANPAGLREIPFQFAMRSGMRKIGQRSVHLAEKFAEAAQQIRSVRIYFGEDGSVNKREQPEEALRSVGERSRGECIATGCWADARQRELRRAQS